MYRFFIVFTTLFLFLRLGLFYLTPFSFPTDKEVSFTTTLLEDPKVVGNSQQFFLSVGDFWHSTKVLVKTNSDESFSYGQTLEVNGHIQNLPRSGGLQPRTPEGHLYVASTLFDSLLKNERTVLTIQNPQIKAKNSGFLPLFTPLRQKIIDFCENNFSQPYSGLLVGIIFGIKSLLTDQITRSFRITGLSHIVAASGMNVTLVAGFLISLLGAFLKRQWAIVVSIGGIFLYVTISGFEGSIVRAALMGSIAFSASLFGRQYSALYILFLVGATMLLWSPLLLFDVGFQLSILATAGILVLKSSLFNHSILGDDLSTTLAAQAATLPIILATFGQYSLLSILANVLVLWTIPLIMIIGGVGIVIGLILEPLGRLIVWMCIPLLWYLQSITAFFAGHAVLVQINSLPIFFTLGYYLLLVSLVIFFRRK